MTRTQSFVGGMAATVALAGCGAGGAKEARAPSAEEPDAIGEAQAAIDRARADLGLAPRGLASAEKSADSRAPAAQAAAPPAAPAPMTSATPTHAGSAAQPSPEPAPVVEESRALRCATLCRALSSMRRAQESLCRLTGPSDARCAEGKRSVAEAERLCSGCGC